MKYACALLSVMLPAVVLANGAKNALWNDTWTDKLQHDLLTSYNKFVRPSPHDKNTTVSLQLHAINIQIVESRSMMQLYSWLIMKWNDEKMKWNPADYGGIEQLRVAASLLWQPDITLYNSASLNNEIDYYADTNHVVYSNGQVLWVPPTKLNAYCALDLRRWPFDTQICTIKFGSWTYDAFQIDLRLDNMTMDWSDDRVQGSEWSLMKMDAERHVKYYSCCPEPYVDITYQLTIKRRSAQYTPTVIPPVIAVIILTLSSFWISPNAGHKIVVNAFTSLLTTYMLMSINQRLPVIGNHTPLIIYFYGISLVTAAVSLAISVMLYNLAKSARRKSVPDVLRRLMTSWLGRFLYTHSAQADEEGGKKPAASHDVAEWYQLGMVVDRAGFYCYCLVCLLLPLTLI